MNMQITKTVTKIKKSLDVKGESEPESEQGQLYRKKMAIFSVEQGKNAIKKIKFQNRYTAPQSWVTKAFFCNLFL